MSEIPDEEKTAIATHFLLSSPPGEIKEVLSDVKVVLNPPSLLTDGVLKGIFRKYNLQTFETADLNGKRIIISEFGELDPKHYLTPTCEVVSVDHVTQKATAASGEGTPTYTPGPLAGLRGVMQSTIEDYCANQYFETACTAYELKDNHGIAVVISASKIQLRSYWAGKWRSEWTFDPKAKTASGKVRISCHYFEDGNVQLEETKDIAKKDLKVSGSDDKSFAEAARDFISKEEGLIQDTLEEMFVNMSQETFKDMRRILPLTKTKMDWSGAQMKMASGMGKSKGQ